MNFEGKNVLVGVTGGIAAYKAAELVSILRKNGACVRVIMTESAVEFITPVTFQTLSGFPVCTEMFPDRMESFIPHIENAEWADIFAVVPATANIIGKIANGIADDLLTSTVMAAASPVVLAPAMNVKMYENCVCQNNIELLKKLGFHIIEPDTGRLACEEIGKGRLPPIEIIIEYLESVLTDKDLKGQVIIITAGGTREPIDPVRHISNRSSGKMGYALASAAAKRGAEVTLISGPTDLRAPYGVDVIEVETAREMFEACKKAFKNCNIMIKAAAVSDFEPVNVKQQKIKKNQAEASIALKKTPDILKNLGEIKSDGQYLVGFCAETEKLRETACSKLIDKNLDMIVANNVSEGIFDSEDTSVLLLTASGLEKEYKDVSKRKTANYILDAVISDT